MSRQASLNDRFEISMQGGSESYARGDFYRDVLKFEREICLFVLWLTLVLYVRIMETIVICCVFSLPKE